MVQKISWSDKIYESNRSDLKEMDTWFLRMRYISYRVYCLLFTSLLLAPVLARQAPKMLPFLPMKASLPLQMRSPSRRDLGPYLIGSELG